LDELAQWSQIHGDQSVTLLTASHADVSIFADDDDDDNPATQQPATKHTEVQLRVTVPEEYPAKLPQIEVINQEMNQVGVVVFMLLLLLLLLLLFVCLFVS
jgi:hypothetical protein